MKLRNLSRAAFTLLELVVVLALLAVVTAVAVRSVDGLDSQRRFESSAQLLQDLQEAVLGSPDDLSTDGSRTVNGFVADMGRLPQTILAPTAPDLELRELWERPAPAFVFDVRPALMENGVPAADIDPQVLVPGGWRGPYLRLPIGRTSLLDAWGNPVSSPTDVLPVNPDTTGYGRLRDASDNPITSTGQPVELVRLLGANGRRDSLDTGYDQDSAVVFSVDAFGASITGHIEVMDNSGPAPANPTQFITVRLFGPNPSAPNKIAVLKTIPLQFNSNPVTFTVTGGTIGTRVVRAYLHTENESSAAESLRRSAVKQVTLRGGVNLLEVKIDR
jgi:prepilin-type N-terminal cleavage/methylation domain-containing protein